MAWTYTVGHNFDVHTPVSEHTQHTSNACCKLTLGLPHYMCGIQVQQIRIGNRLYNWSASIFCNNILPLMKYMGSVVLINKYVEIYVETKVILSTVVES